MFTRMATTVLVAVGLFAALATSPRAASADAKQDREKKANDCINKCMARARTIGEDCQHGSCKDACPKGAEESKPCEACIEKCTSPHEAEITSCIQACPSA